MRYKVDHDLHIHTHLSLCSKDPEQNTEEILEHAKRNGFSTICVTDHYWDTDAPTPSNFYAPQNFEHVSLSLPLPRADGVSFYFGCEADMNVDLALGIPPSRYNDFDFIIIPTTHLHMKNFTISADDFENNQRKAELWVNRFDALLGSSLPFKKTGVAHLACGLLCRGSREDYLSILDMIPSSELERLFAKAAEVGLGIELNQGDMRFKSDEADTVLRMFRIAKHQGCKFYLGSDAHHPRDFEDSREVFERAVDLLGLEEKDKFLIER